MTKSKPILAVVGAAALAGCGNSDSTHLVFGQKISVGLEINATAPEQGGSLSLGYKDNNIAIIPVAVKNADGTSKEDTAATQREAEVAAQEDQENGLYQRLGSANRTDGSDENDAYSTLGQFEMDTGKNGIASVGLGKFFATGIAAQKLAAGFMMKLSKQQTAGVEQEPDTP